MGSPYKTVAFQTLGCKLNFTETSTLARDFTSQGYAQVGNNDTADLYGNGRVEKMLGSIFLKKNDIKICTKYGNRYYKNKIYFDTSSEYFNFSLENSLKRLKREKIDFYLLHSPPSDFVISNSLFNAINNAIKNHNMNNIVRNITKNNNFILRRNDQ